MVTGELKNSNRDILSLKVPIPPIELQQQFAAFVAQIDKSKYTSTKPTAMAAIVFLVFMAISC